jgi:hypothetical protein
MKTELTAGGVIALTAIAGIGLVLYLNRGAIKGVVQAVNPASDQNLAYRAFSAGARAVTGDDRATFGTALYDLKARLFPSAADYAAAHITDPVPVGPNAWDAILARKAGDVRTEPANDNWMQMVQGSLFGPDAIGPDGRPEATLKMTPATWMLVAGVSVALYAAHKRGRRRTNRRVGRRRASR